MPENLSKMIGELQRDIAAGFDDLQERFAETRKETAELRRGVLSRLDAIHARFDRLGNEYQALAAAVSRLESRSITRTDFEREIELLRDRVVQLEQRVTELERTSRQR